ncbi:MAG: DUF4279 domain-containing protein [Candidatus Kapabacteria bacterium]|nr:DUF4279 domain-containing protein [Candidatus Kapabacteria bacterium]
MPHRTLVSLRITGENFKHEDITTLFDMSPTEMWNLNDKGVYVKKYTFSNWCYQSPLPERSPLDHHIRFLMAKFRGKEHCFDALPEESYVSLLCAIYIDVTDDSTSARTPDMGLTRDAINWLSRIRANFDNDAYLRNYPQGEN